jgi:hypothetical protein
VLRTDLTGAFRGSAAVAAGALTPDVLRGSRYRRLFPDVYAPAALTADLTLRSQAAHVLVEPDGVLSSTRPQTRRDLVREAEPAAPAGPCCASTHPPCCSDRTASSSARPGHDRV